MNDKYIYTNNQDKFLVYYQRALAIGAVVVFFTKLDVYLGLRGLLPISPLLWIILFIMASFPLLLLVPSKLRSFPPNLIAWSLFYIGVSCFGLMVALPSVPGVPIETTVQDLETRILATFSLCLMAYILSTKDKLIYEYIQKSILVVTLINVFNSVLEFFQPEIFGLADKIPGRSAAFYVNANELAIALIIGMILSISIVPRKHRFLFALVVFIGNLFTFSRGGFLGWIIVTFALTRFKIIPRKQIVTWIIGISLGLLILVTQLGTISSALGGVNSSLLTDDTLSRISWISKGGNTIDPDGGSRFKIAVEALHKFANSPIIGHGISSSRETTGHPLDTNNIDRSGEQPHNIHLVNSVEHGFLGMIIFPSLLLASISRGRGEVKQIGIVFVLYFLVAGFLTHTILYDNYSLFSIAFMFSFSKVANLQNQPNA